MVVLFHLCAGLKEFGVRTVVEETVCDQFSVREGRSCSQSSNSLVKALCLIFFPSNLLSAVTTKIKKKVKALFAH